MVYVLFVGQIKLNMLMCNNLTNPIKVRLTNDQERAISELEKLGFNRSKFIRLAVEEKLKRDYRSILSELKKTINRNPGDPDWIE